MTDRPAESRAGGFLALGACLLMAGGAATHATVTPAGDELQVNAFVAGKQTEADVAFAPSGEFVIVWTSDGQDGDSLGVFGRRFTSLGEPIGGDFQVNTFTAGRQASPRVAMDGSGRFMVVWQSDDQDGSGSGVFAQRFDPSGARVGPELQASVTTIGSQMEPAVSADAAGNFILVWLNLQFTPPARGEIVARTFDGASASFLPESVVTTELASFDLFPAVAMVDAGGAIVVWSRPIAGVYDTAVLYGRRLDAAGRPDGPEFMISTPDPDMVYGDYAGRVDINGRGEFVVAWERRADGVPQQILVRPYDAGGAPRAGETPIVGEPFELKSSPDVMMEAGGSFVATWHGPGTRAQRFTPLGSPDGSEVPVDTESGTFDQAAAIDAHASGNFVVAWARRPSVSDAEVRARRFLALCAPPGVPGLDLALVNGGSDIRFTWSDVVQADDYLVLEDTVPGGAFVAQTGIAPTGVTGLTVPAPGPDRFYLVAGRDADCGVGPLR